VKDQSHKDEMSAALRGDFQRLRDRGVSSTLAPVETLKDERPAEPVETVEPVTEDEPVAASLPERPDEPPAPVTPVIPEPESEPDPETPSGWLGRLLGR